MTIQRVQTGVSDRGTWGTPMWLFERYRTRYDFTIDLAALPWNAKLPSFISPEMDALNPATPWGGRGWLNPVYSNILPWATRARAETHAGTSDLVVMLLPVRTSTEWFHDFVRPHAQIEWLRDRVAFDPPKDWTGKRDSPAEDSMIVVFEKVWRPRAHRRVRTAA